MAVTFLGRVRLGSRFEVPAIQHKFVESLLARGENVVCCISFLLYQKLIIGDAQMKQQVAS